MKAVFVDALYWVAIMRPNDRWRDQARLTLTRQPRKGDSMTISEAMRKSNEEGEIVSVDFQGTEKSLFAEIRKTWDGATRDITDDSDVMEIWGMIETQTVWGLQVTLREEKDDA